MSYEIVLRDGDRDLIEKTATLDHALLRMKKLSKDEDYVGHTLIVIDTEGRGRVVRAYAYYGHLYWARACRPCKGKGMKDKYNQCSDCMGLGSVCSDQAVTG